VFVFPSNFEGRALVVIEAMACGLPIVTTAASGVDDAIDDQCGRIIPADNLDALVETFRWCALNRDRLPALKQAARLKAESFTWTAYRHKVLDAVRPII
jgi:glycosyltransferase involved in cell wall biosynthesis